MVRKRKVGAPADPQHRIQQLIAGLIIFNVAAVLLYALFLRHLSVGKGVLIPGLLIIYNLLLCQLVVRRARRRGDLGLIYIGTFTCIAACTVLLYYFFG